jgi:SOS response regulatory protein OraA/RecX
MTEEEKRAYSHSLYLLDERSYSVARMREKLAAKYAPATVEMVLGRLTDEGYLNDEKYARHTAEYMAEVKRFGLYRIKQELVAKGISKELAAACLESLQTYEVDAIKERIRKKYISNIGTPAGERKIQAAMARYGFKLSDIIKALGELREENAAEG